MIPNMSNFYSGQANRSTMERIENIIGRHKGNKHTECLYRRLYVVSKMEHNRNQHNLKLIHENIYGKGTYTKTKYPTYSNRLAFWRSLE